MTDRKQIILLSIGLFVSGIVLLATSYIMMKQTNECTCKPVMQTTPAVEPVEINFI